MRFVNFLVIGVSLGIGPLAVSVFSFIFFPMSEIAQKILQYYYWPGVFAFESIGFLDPGSSGGLEKIHPMAAIGYFLIVIFTGLCYSFIIAFILAHWKK
jgi:hypothetical protein